MVIANWQDMRLAAQKRLPKMFFDYIDSAAFSEQTAKANIEDFDQWLLEQNVLVGVGSRDLSVTYLGRKRPLPMILGPVGFSGLFSVDGEVKAARAAHKHGVPFCLSIFGIVSLERLRKSTDGDLWFQLYVLKDKSISEDFLARARATECEALVVTVDTAVGGIREKDIRNGFRVACRLTLPMALRLARKPLWCLQAISGGFPRIENMQHRPEYGRYALEQAAKLNGQADPNLSWDDIEWLRDRWKGKLIVKGILNAGDAGKCAQAGADGIVISNHGGRQLDCSPSTISVLPEIVEEVGNRLDVLIDGGFRRGTQIVKAIALGAKGVLLGRAYAYALGAGGQAQVDHLLKLLKAEVDCTVGHMGLTAFNQLRPNPVQYIRHRTAREPAPGRE
jgi:isopentenyl diphosphate isomerase/L-lactate dehydrogenase-like FMN-dependent dehydrogenase